MEKLIQGIVDFRQNLRQKKKKLFAELALGQKPDALFIACSDSRVVPNVFASTNPGDLFVLRNVGNLIPPASSVAQDTSAQATIEFSLFSLQVKDIIICGHSECGAMHAITHGLQCSSSCQHLALWLEYGKAALQKVQAGTVFDPNLSLSNQVSQMNVVQQMEHIATYPFVQERLAKKSVHIHGWWFDIAQAEVYYYEPTQRKFIVIDEITSQFILKKQSK